MKGLLIAIVTGLAMIMASVTSSYAKDFDGVSLEGSVSSGGLSMYHSEDDVDVGFRYTRDVPGYTAGGSIYYEHTSGDANIVGLGLHGNKNIWQGILGISTDVGWDISGSDLDSDTELKYTIFNIGAYTNLSMDIDDLQYNGTDIGLDYTLRFSDNLSLIPSVEVPFDSDGTRGDAVAALHIAVTF